MLTLKIDHRATLFPLEAQAHQRLVEQIARRLLRAGRLPVKKDEAGRLMLTNLDYYQSLVG